MQSSTKNHILKSILTEVYSPIYTHLIDKSIYVLSNYNLRELEYKNRIFSKYDHSHAYIKLYGICNYSLNTYIPSRLPKQTITKELKQALDSITKLDNTYYEQALVYKAFILRILNNSSSITDIINLLPFTDSSKFYWFINSKDENKLTLSQEYIDKFKFYNSDMYQHHKLVKAHSLLLN
jgi:hypothetical protein